MVMRPFDSSISLLIAFRGACLLSCKRLLIGFLNGIGKHLLKKFSCKERSSRSSTTDLYKSLPYMIQKIPIPAICIFKTAAHFLLHPPAASSAELPVSAIAAKYGELLPLFACRYSWTFVDCTQRVPRQITYCKRIQAVKITGIHGSVCLHNNLRLAVSADSASCYKPSGKQLDQIIKQLHAPVLSVTEFLIP